MTREYRLPRDIYFSMGKKGEKKKKKKVNTRKKAKTNLERENKQEFS